MHALHFAHAGRTRLSERAEIKPLLWLIHHNRHETTANKSVCSAGVGIRGYLDAPVV